jgi:hypothetical protein
MRIGTQTRLGPNTQVFVLEYLTWPLCLTPDVTDPWYFMRQAQVDRNLTPRTYNQFLSLPLCCVVPRLKEATHVCDESFDDNWNTRR